MNATVAAACTSCGFNPGSVSPSDAVVALRSFPRRYGALVASIDPDERDRLLRAGSPSAVDHLVDAARALGGSGSASADDPRALADGVGAAAVARADEADRRSGDEWKDQHLLDALRETVHSGIHHLRLAERAVEAALKAR
jgi:hypothetical protein